MRRCEANEYADRVNGYPDMKAKVVRILPLHADPIVVGDNGWDVEITVEEDQ